MKPARLTQREPILVTELCRDLLLILLFLGAVYSDSTLITVLAGVFTLAASIVMSCVVRAVSLPILLPREPELPELPEPGPAGHIPDGD